MASEPVLAGNELFPPPMLKYYYGYKPRIGRKMRVLLSKDSPIWHTAVVKSYIIVASNKNGYEWKQPSIVLEFDNEKNDDDNNDDDGNDDDNDGRDDGDVDDKSGSVSTNFPPGAYVKIQGLVNASHHNGRCGIVLGRQEQQQQPQGKKGKKKKTKDIASLLLVRYKVQISNDNILSIKPQNLIKKSLNNSPKDDDDDDGVGGGYHRLIYRIHPSIGGILTGKTSKGVDASEKISFEWIDGEKDDKKEMNNENKEEDGVEAKKEKEKEENEKENTTLAIATRSSSFQQGDYVVIYGLGEKHTSTSTSTGISEQNNCQYYGMVLSIPRNNNNDNYQYKVRIVKSETNNNNKSECGGGELVTPDTEIILVHKSNMKFVERNVFPPIVPIPIKDVVDLTIATLGLDDPIYLETLNKKRKNPSPLNITLLNPDLLEDKFIRLITAGDSVALGKFLLEVDVDYIFRRLGEENFNLLKHDIAWTLDIKIMILCVSLYCKKLGLTTWFVSAEEKYHTAKKSLYVGTTIALATSIAEDITLNHNYGIWPEALKWVQLVVEESESLSSRLDLSSSLKNGFESIHGFNYTELIKTNVKIGNFGKAVELSQGATHVVEQNGVSEMLKKFDFEDVELDFLNEWPKVTAMYCLLEEQRRFMKIRYGVTNFRIIKNGATDHVTQNDFDCCYKNCPIQYPCFPSLLPVSQKVLDKIQDKDVRDTYEQMMNGNFEVDWIDRDELLWLSFSASSGPLRSERVLSGMNIKTNHERAAVFAEGGIYGIVVQDVASMAGTSDGSFKKYLTDDEKLKMSYRLTHIFVRRYASSLQKINPKSIWQYLIKHYTNNKKWKDAYDAQRMLTTSVMAAENNNDDDSTNTTKYNVCCQIGEALEAIGKYQDAGCAYYQASKFFKPGSHDSQGGSHVMNLIHNAGLAYKRNMQYELAGKYFIEALHYGSQLSSSAKRWDFNERECSNVINSMLNNYNRRVREATLDGNTCNKVNSVFMSFLCLLYVSGFKSSTCCEEFRIGRSMYNIVLKTQYRKKKIAKQTLFNALVTGNVEEFESSMERTTTPGTDKMHLQANMDMPTKKDIKQASREQLRDNETIQATSSLFLHQCTRCDKHLENMLQCPCRTVS